MDLNSLNAHLFFQDVYLQNIYRNEVEEEKDSSDIFKYQTFQLLEQPFVVSDSFHLNLEQVFVSRLERLKRLGFCDVYSDSGQVLLFHNLGGLCSLDKMTCMINGVFYDRGTFAVRKVSGLSDIKCVLDGKNMEVSYVDDFSYLDLPLVSKRDEESLPRVENVDDLVGNINREQKEHFEQTGYVLNVDCRFLHPFIANSLEEYEEARESLMIKKMNCLPEEIQRYFHYSLDNFTKTK